MIDTAPRKADARPPEVRHRIVVVDDDPTLLNTFQRVLQSGGYAVETFSSGDAFLRSLLARTPECVILDLSMPGVTGFEVQSRIAEARVQVPVIVITGYDSPEHRCRAESGGAAAYLPKPVSTDALLAAIEACLGRDPETPPRTG